MKLTAQLAYNQIIINRRRTIYKLIRDGDIKAFKIGKSYKVPKQHIISYLKL